MNIHLDKPFPNIQTVADFSDLTRPMKNHITNVYITLAGTFLCCAAGAYAHLLWHLGGFLTFIGQIVALIALTSTPHRKETLFMRLGLLAGFGFLTGCSMGPLINYALFVDPRIVVTAFLGTLCIFVCFSAVAVLSKSRSWLFLGGFLSSAISLMVLLSFVNIFFRSETIMLFQLYGGLLVFSGYVIVDTQMMIERSRNSDDFIADTVQLFVDFVAIFVRVLIILTRNKQNDKDKRRR